MNRMLRVLGCGVISLAFASSSAQATSGWASWVANSPTLATGSFADGTTVTFSGNVVGIEGPADTAMASPVIPGEPSGGNPPGVGAVTGVPHPVAIDPGAFIMAMDLSDLTIDDHTTFALSDMFDAARYRLELLDATFGALPLDGVVVTNYNLENPGVFLADYDVRLDAVTGALRVTVIHDGDPLNTYRHSGLVTFSNLPLATRFIRITSNSPAQQVSEGVHFYIGVVPEPATEALGLTAIAAFALRRSRRRASRGA